MSDTDIMLQNPFGPVVAAVAALTGARPDPFSLTYRVTSGKDSVRVDYDCRPVRGGPPTQPEDAA